MKHQIPTMMALFSLLLLPSCSSSDGGVAGDVPSSRAKPNSVIGEQIVEIGGRKYRQQRILITDVPYETKLQVVPFN